MHINSGNAYVRFGASMGTPISGINYRLSQAGGEKWEGTSNDEGNWICPRTSGHRLTLELMIPSCA